MSEDADYAAIYETLKLATSETVDIDARETLLTQPQDWRDTLRSSLPQLPLGGESGAQFQLAHVLGRGGMGVVHLAFQSALGRHVAIKTVPEDRSSRESENALLQEARVMGLVEHPNVVPVHIIGQDAAGRPIIVMKRIEGTTWDIFLDHKKEPETDDVLGFHVNVAIAVCRAISFAHDRRILHRDIKPENVMIGRFGEVYVLDWGLAVSLDKDVPFVPYAGTSDHVVGTPAYMAPEMTIGRGKELSEQTDVFLLGAVLYHVVTGEPPNQGQSLFDVLACAYEGRARSYEAGVQSELREICERAMALAPEQRFASVDELRAALLAFLAHRNSYDLTATAFERLAQLEDAVESGDGDEAHRSFGEARFGFLSALEIWPENVEARDGLQACLRAMIEHELECENPPAARALMSQLEEPDEELSARIAELERALTENAARLEKIAYDHNENVGIAIKQRVVAAMAFLFAFGGLTYHVVLTVPIPAMFTAVTTDPDVFWACAWGFTFFPVVLLLYAVTTRDYGDHKASRIFAKSMAVMYLFGFVTRSASLTVVFGAPLTLTTWAESGLYAACLMLLGLSTDRRLFASGVVFVFTAIVILVVDAYPFELFSAGGCAACLSFLSFDAGVRIGLWKGTDAYAVGPEGS